MAVRGTGASGAGRLSASISTGTAMTIMGWVMIPSTVAAVQHIFGASDTGPDGYVCTNSGGTQIGWYIDFLFRGGFTITNGVWYHYCHTLNGTSNILYRNGTQQTTYTVSNPPTLLNIFGNASGEHFDGYIENVKLFSRVLTAAEIIAESLSIAPRNRNSLYAWYPLIEGFARTADFSGNGRTLTEAGTLTYAPGPPVAWGEHALDVWPEVFPLEQSAFRFRNNDGDEAAATWRQSENVDDTAAPDEALRLRMQIAAMLNGGSRAFKWQHRKAGAADWRDIE